jgi:hypothetical protein
MSRILAFSGKKQSGKNTLCNFLHGYQLKSFGVIEGFDILEDGKLIVDTMIKDDNGKDQRGMGEIDVTRTDIEFSIWAMDSVWPFIKHYAFATTLKEIAIGLFNIDRELLYGTDEQKNTLLEYKWENMPTKIKGKSGFMTVREFIQYLGTEIFRKIYPDVWTNKAIADILSEEPHFAVVTDVRFENEIKAIQDAGGKVIRLTRSIESEDSHTSELELDNYDGFDAVIDTKNLNIQESCVKLLEILEEWKWFNNEIVIPPRRESFDRKKNVTTIK